MAYNLGGTFKDVLKVISLGVMASINGVSNDVVAMDDTTEDGGFARGRSFMRCNAVEYQSNLDPNVAFQLSMERSLQEVPSHSAAGAASAGAGAGYAEEQDPADALHAHFESLGNPDDDAAIARALNELELQENLKIEIQREKYRSRRVAEEGPGAASIRQEFAEASSWDVDRTQFVSKSWDLKGLEGDEFHKHILGQFTQVFFHQIQPQNPHCSIGEALPHIATNLKIINTGTGVSDKIDEILNELL